MDKEAFLERVLPARNRLFRLAKLFLRHREEAEDTTQEVLLRLWQNRQTLDGYHNVEALAVRMTHNLCLDKLKATKNRPTVDVGAHLAQPDHASPHQQTERADNATLLHHLLAQLPDQQKMVLHLRDVEDYDFADIAQLTGLTINNVRVILSRARKTLREHYLKHHDYDGR